MDEEKQTKAFIQGQFNEVLPEYGNFTNFIYEEIKMIKWGVKVKKEMIKILRENMLLMYQNLSYQKKMNQVMTLSKSKKRLKQGNKQVRMSKKWEIIL